MEADETNVKGTAITMLSRTLPCGIDAEARCARCAAAAIRAAAAITHGKQVHYRAIPICSFKEPSARCWLYLALYAPLHALSFPQMLTFGVLAALMMSWDGAYTSAADQLRLLPGQAAECLRKWATLCRTWAVRPLLLALGGLGTAGLAGYISHWRGTAMRQQCVQLSGKCVQLQSRP